MITAQLWRLSPDDTVSLQALLDLDPLLNVYLRSELRVGGSGNGQWWGLGSPGRLRAALVGGPLVVPWIPDLEDAERLAEALVRQQPARLLVGPRDQVVALDRAWHPGTPPRETRDP